MKKLTADELIKHTKEVVDELFYSIEILNITAIMKKAEISRSFIYSHKELLEYINKSQVVVNSDTLKEAIANLEEENNALIAEIRKYEQKNTYSIITKSPIWICYISIIAGYMLILPLAYNRLVYTFLGPRQRSLHAS